MKRTTQRTLMGAVAVAAATMTIAAGTWSMPPLGGGDGSSRANRMMHALDLDDAQREAVESRLAESRAVAEADRRRMKELRTEARGLREDYDAGRAQQIADEIGEISGRLALVRMATQADIYSLLDEEQRAELEAKMERRKAWRQGWREGRRSSAT